MEDKEDRAETEVRERAVRRTFSAAYKARILKEIGSAPSGGIAAILRREGLYSSHIAKWREEATAKQREERRRGRKKNPHTDELKKLRREKERLERQLYRANKIIELQKKVAEILEEEIDESE
ncbi:MAG: transposase [Candidatus Obscuribacterales bacterium]|nr:transposase [Candidatus Obscuribacterales bacterium]